jgi:hypothetical protein
LQSFASAVSQRMSIVHTVSGLRGSAFALATHAGAWQGVDGAQSASVVQASSEILGSHREQSHVLGSPGSAAPVAPDVGEGLAGLGATDALPPQAAKATAARGRSAAGRNMVAT